MNSMDKTPVMYISNPITIKNNKNNKRPMKKMIDKYKSNILFANLLDEITYDDFKESTINDDTTTFDIHNIDIITNEIINTEKYVIKNRIINDDSLIIVFVCYQTQNKIIYKRYTMESNLI